MQERVDRCRVPWGPLRNRGTVPVTEVHLLVHGESWLGDGSCGSLDWGWAEPVEIGEHGR